MTDFLMGVYSFMVKLLLVFIVWGVAVTIYHRKGIKLYWELERPPKYSLSIYMLTSIVAWVGVDWDHIKFCKRKADISDRLRKEEKRARKRDNKKFGRGRFKKG